jgi:hypothetical protein
MREVAAHNVAVVVTHDDKALTLNFPMVKTHQYVMDY